MLTSLSPARHRDKAGKLYLPAVQKMVSDHKPENSSIRQSKDGSQIKLMFPVAGGGGITGSRSAYITVG
jgi:hypothetical protein